MPLWFTVLFPQSGPCLGFLVISYCSYDLYIIKISQGNKRNISNLDKQNHAFPACKKSFLQTWILAKIRYSLARFLVLPVSALSFQLFEKPRFTESLSQLANNSLFNVLSSEAFWVQLGYGRGGSLQLIFADSFAKFIGYNVVSCRVYSSRSFQVLILHSIWHFAIKSACMLHRTHTIMWWIAHVERWGHWPNPSFSKLWTKRR